MIRDLHELKKTPVPSSALVIAKKEGYRNGVRIDLAGPRAAEACVDVRGMGVAGANHYNLRANPPYHVSIPGSIPDLFVRRGAADRLKAVNDRLGGMGLALHVFDAWRPQAVQRYFHDVWFPAWLAERKPDLSGAALLAEVERYWAAPSAGAGSPSPHATGGAVDLTLIFSETRQPLFMGGIFDDLTEEAWTDAYERRPALSMSDEEARANRRVLYWAMSEAGFANNPTEWWHYSWGDQMWARLTDQPCALYGACDPTGLEPG